MDRDDGELWGKIILLIFAIIFAIWFYSADASGAGWVENKWVETNTSCDDDGCTTTHSYMTQFRDGRVYKMFWGTRDWDPLQMRSEIAFSARGRFISFLGWRIAVPDIFSWELLTAPQY